MHIAQLADLTAQLADILTSDEIFRKILIGFRS